MLVAGGFCGNLFAFHLPDECHLQKRSDVRRVVFRRKVMPDIADGIADRQNGWLRGVHIGNSYHSICNPLYYK